MQQVALVRRILAGCWALGFGAYLIHGLITDTGLIGWIEYAQQSVIGSYSMKLTVLAAMLVWLFSILLLLPRADRDAAKSWQQRANAPLSRKGVLTLCACLIGFVWVGGLAVRWWFVQQETEDYEATYEELRLQPDANPAPNSNHIALWGEPLDDAAVTFSQNNTTSYYLIPVVAAEWHEDQPISFVVKSKTSDLRELPRYDATLRQVVRPTRPVLARLTGVVSVPAAQEFERMGLKLAEPHYLLERIPSVDGKPPAPNLAQAQLAYLCIAGFLTFLIVVFGAVVIIKRPKQIDASLPVRPPE